MEALLGVILIVLFFVLITVMVVYLSRIRTVGPNQVLIISGRRRMATNPLTGEKEELSYRIVRAGRAFIWPVLERVDVLSLELLTIEVGVDDAFKKILGSVEDPQRRLNLLFGYAKKRLPDNDVQAFRKSMIGYQREFYARIA